MTSIPAPVPSRVLTLDDVDALHNHAHRIGLYGSLVANALDEYTKYDNFEGLQALVIEMITDAQAIETVLEQLGRVAEKGGV